MFVKRKLCQKLVVRAKIASFAHNLLQKDGYLIY